MSSCRTLSKWNGTQNNVSLPCYLLHQKGLLLLLLQKRHFKQEANSKTFVVYIDFIFAFTEHFR